MNWNIDWNDMFIKITYCCNVQVSTYFCLLSYLYRNQTFIRSAEQKFYSHHQTVIRSQETASLSHVHNHTRAYELMQSMETRYHMDLHTFSMGLHISSAAKSAVVRVILFHIVCWKQPHLETQDSECEIQTFKGLFFCFFFEIWMFADSSPGRTPLLSTSRCDLFWR